MKILVAIESDKQAMRMAHTTLRWAARSSYNMRVFIPDNRQRRTYEKAVDDANYHYYFDIPPTVIESNAKNTPMEFAKAEGFDLLVTLPDNMLDYRTVQDDDKTFIEFVTDVAAARSLFGKEPELVEVELEQGAKIVRV